MNKQNENLIIRLAVIGAVYFGIIKPILNKTGITKSSEEREADRVIDEVKNLPNNQNPFSPLFYQTREARQNEAVLLYDSLATQLCKKIYNALGVFSDDETAIYSVFRSLKTKSQVSFLADKFNKMYKQDLFSYLQGGYSSYNPANGLNEKEMKIIVDIVNKLPKYKAK